MNNRHSLLCRAAAVLVVLPAVLAAQVAVTVSTATQIDVFASSSSGSQVQSVPANTVGFDLADAITGGAYAHSQWSGFSRSFEVGVDWDQSLAVFESAPALATTGANELLVNLQASGSVPVLLEVTSTIVGSPGGILPSFDIDIGDDGAPEVSAVNPGPFTLALVLGGQSTTIRLRSQLAVFGAGSLTVGLKVRVRPDNRLLVSPALLPCENYDLLYANPVFAGRGVEFGVVTSLPMVLVIGLNPQPVLLPSGLPTPCLLLPSPDLLVPIGVLPGGSVNTTQLAIPAAVRPLTLWAQGVAVWPAGLTTTTAFAILAW